MKDNVLKKEFQRKDVERIRNLVKGNQGERITQGIGYSKNYGHHEEGDVWQEGDRTWTIKNGIKQNVTKLDKFKEMGKLPLFCPECGTIMKKHLDKKVYPAYHKCFDCVVDHEAELKKQGKAQEYYDNLHNANIDKTIKEYRAYMENALNEKNNGYVTEAGDVENWNGGMSREELEKNLQEGLEYLEKLKIT